MGVVIPEETLKKMREDKKKAHQAMTNDGWSELNNRSNIVNFATTEPESPLDSSDEDIRLPALNLHHDLRQAGANSTAQNALMPHSYIQDAELDMLLSDRRVFEATLRRIKEVEQAIKEETLTILRQILEGEPSTLNAAADDKIDVPLTIFRRILEGKLSTSDSAADDQIDVPLSAIDAAQVDGY